MTTGGRGPVTIKDLTAGLIWPLLFKAVPVALQPSRLLVAFIGVAIIMGVGVVHDLIAAAVVGPDALGQGVGVFEGILVIVSGAIGGFSRGVITLDGENIANSARLLGALRGVFEAHPVSGVVLAVVGCSILALVGGAISRMVVCDIALEQEVGSARAIAFSLSRAKDLILAVLAPPFVLVLIALGLALLGLLLLRLPGLNIVGGLAYGLMLLGGFALVALGLALALGHPLLVPAIAAESTDWFDAIQRAYAYVLGRTGRLIVYTAVLLVYGAVAFAIAAFVTTRTLNATADLAFAWTGAPDPPAAYAGGYDTFTIMVPARAEGLDGTRLITARIIGIWERFALALLGAFVVSYYFAASSVLYLLARRVNDDQDIHEIWRPGMIEGAMAPVRPAPAPAAGDADAE